MNHRYRCGNPDCRKRVTLPRLKELYVREPACKACGTKLHSVEKERKAYARRMNCSCDGLPFTPHRKGSKWCVHYEGEYDQHDLQERHYG